MCLQIEIQNRFNANCVDEADFAAVETEAGSKNLDVTLIRGNVPEHDGVVWSAAQPQLNFGLDIAAEIGTYLQIGGAFDGDIKVQTGNEIALICRRSSGTRSSEEVARIGVRCENNPSDGKIAGENTA